MRTRHAAILAAVILMVLSGCSSNALLIERLGSAIEKVEGLKVRAEHLQAASVPNPTYDIDGIEAWNESWAAQIAEHDAIAIELRAAKALAQGKRVDEPHDAGRAP